MALDLLSIFIPDASHLDANFLVYTLGPGVKNLHPVVPEPDDIPLN